VVRRARTFGILLTVTMATALGSSFAGCLGEAPELLTADAALDATTVGEASPLDDATNEDVSSTDGGPPGDALVEGGQGCLDGGACSPGPCELGAVACSADGAASCAMTVMLDNGTLCDAGGDAASFCSGGTCVACNAGADCTTPGSCNQANIACNTGSPVCTPAGSVVDGKPCGTNGTNLYCNQGQCELCMAGTGCAPSPPGNPCDKGTISCSSQGQATCTDTQVAAADGTPCAPNKVCSAGQCLLCTANLKCTPSMQPCHTGLTSCASGTSTCPDLDAGQNGIGCDDDSGCTQTDTCQGGVCTGSNPVSCPATDSCHTAGTCTPAGATSHSCSNPVASNTTSCGTNEVCTNGSCGCATGYTSCGPGVCVNLSNDPKNCGTCGHPCQGGMCFGSQCQPVALGTFSDTPADIAIGSSFVYAAIASGSMNGGTVARCSVSGCTTGAGAEVFVMNQPQYMDSIVANSAGVFWTGLQAAGGSAAGCAPADCSKGVVTYETSGAEQPYTIASDGTNVYFTILNNGGTFQGIQSCPVGGCPSGPSNLFVGGTPFYIAVASGSIYWADALDPSSIKKCSASSCPGTPTNIATSPSTDIYRYVATDGSNVYWVDSTSDVAFECPVTGCPSSGPIVLGTSAGPVTVDSTGVYWATNNSIVRCAIGGCSGSPTTVVPGITPNPSSPRVLLDTANIYWMSGTTLMKIAR